MGLTVLTPPTIWPVTLAETKIHLRVEDTTEDALITTYIHAATQHIEQALGLTIAQKQYRLKLDALSDVIELPRGPVISIDAATYLDANGGSQTLNPASYTVDLSSDTQWIVRNSGATWPTTLAGVNAVTIDFTAGYVTAPDDLRAAILLLVGHWFANRETAVVGITTTELPFATMALMQPYRRLMV